MNKQSKDAAEYLRKLGYSVEENTYQNNQSQVGDLSSIPKELEKHEARQKILMAQFQTISDVELIKELRRRVSKQDIKLSFYPHQDHIFITAQDLTKEISFPLPIEINYNNSLRKKEIKEPNHD